jgi:hypothetical protein
MKKIITLAALASTLIAFDAKAQLPDGSIAPNITLKDLSGTTWDLYTLLNSGKTVYLDFSATWCNPCWNVHNRRALDTLYEMHGPAGQPGVSASTTDDVMVLFVEGDDNTTTGCLTNSPSCNTSYAPTQGDWSLNCSYPLLDSGGTAMNNYQNTYFPSVYMICPDRGTHFLGTTQTGTSTYLSTGDLYALRTSTPCAVASASLDASLSNGSPQNSISICDSSLVTVNLTNESTVTLTSATITFQINGVTAKTISWTGSLATYNYTPISVKLLGPVGSNLITAVVSNPNGGTDAVAGNNTNAYTIANVVMTTATVPTVTESFQGASFPPTNWGVVNGGDQTYKWTSSAHGGFQASTKCSFIDLWDTPAGDRDEMVLQTLDLSSAASANMTFDIAKAGITNQQDELRVLASSDCGNTWTIVYDKYDYATTNPLQTATSNSSWAPTASANWRTDNVNLNAYAGMSSVLLKFQTISGYSNNLYIDNINLTTTGIRDINNIGNVRLYPNPATAQASVEVSLVKEDNVTINVYNNMGQLVLSQQHNNAVTGDNTYVLNTENLASGIYNVVTTTKQGHNTQKLSITK